MDRSLDRVGDARTWSVTTELDAIDWIDWIDWIDCIVAMLPCESLWAWQDLDQLYERFEAAGLSP